MKPEDAQRDRKALEIFGRAVELASAEARAAYLEGACGEEATLKVRVEALLANHVEDNFLQQPAASLGPGATAVIPVTEKPGDRIGRYKLLQQIGEGGCGVVYMAEQEEPVRRRVALKVIKLGMDTNSVIARFEAERQALALMDHPNIARVLDAGATDSGRPYFVMELVRGVKITDYCDETKLPTRERLDLFIKVCQAIQHAHQKGIIHRDIKPSNILVTVNDGVAVPKVIDFGIAKATTGQQLTDKTLFTAFEQFIGTPAYMSPEQAVMTSLDIDTRSDIYALGVLLYELLTGKTPFDAKELMAAGFDEMRRTIREKEPARPSTRVSALPGEELSTTAQHRGLEAPRLVNLLRGDLDWIVMKCLEKDRQRRYETANGLARDIERHLNNEPVVARPPSRVYRFQKLVRRNKLAVTMSTAVLLVLALGAVTSTWLAIRATGAEREQARLRQAEANQRALADRRATEARDQAQRAEEEAANAQAVTDFLERMLSSVSGWTLSSEVPAGQTNDPASRAFLLDDREAETNAPVREVTVKEMLRRAVGQIEPSTKGHPLVEANLRVAIGRYLRAIGAFDDGDTQFARAVELYSKIHGPEHPVTLRARAEAYGRDGRMRKLLGPRKKDLQDLVASLEGVLGPEHPDTMRTRWYLYGASSKWPEPGVLRPLVSSIDRVLGPADPITIFARTVLALGLSMDGDIQDAIRLGRETLQMVEAHAPNTPMVSDARARLALRLAEAGQVEEAIHLLQTAVSDQARLLGRDHPDTRSSIQSLVSLLGSQGRWSECLELQGGEDQLETDNPTFRDLARAAQRAGLLVLDGQLDRATGLFDRVLESMDSRDFDRGPRSIALRLILCPALQPLAVRLVEKWKARYDQARHDLAPEDPHRKNLAVLTAALLVAAGRPDEERQMMGELFDAVATRHGMADERVTDLRRMLLDFANCRQVTEEDVSLVEGILKRAEAQLGNNPRVLWLYFNQAAWSLNRTPDKIDVVLDWARKGHRLATQAYGTDSLDTLNAQDTLAVMLMRAGRCSEAVALQEQVLSRADRVETGRFAAEFRYHYALMLACANGPSETWKALHRVCVIRRLRSWSMWFPNQDDWLWSHEYFNALAGILDKQGKAKEAQEWRTFAPLGQR